MAINLSGLSNVTTVAQSLGNLIMVTPAKTGKIEPQSKRIFGLTEDSFFFDYEGENTVTLESDITDHFIEDNTAIQDQIALRPELITVRGFVGELNDIAPFPLDIVKEAAERLLVISAYAPQLTIAALVAYNTAFQLYQTAALAVNAAVSRWTDPFSLSGGTQTKQQRAFKKFYGYYKSRTLFTVQTPWNKFNNLAIKSLRAVQDEQTRVITEFEITFKRMNFASTTTTSVLQRIADAVFQGRLKAQGAAAEDGGLQQTGTDVGLTPLTDSKLLRPS